MEAAPQAYQPGLGFVREADGKLDAGDVQGAILLYKLGVHHLAAAAEGDPDGGRRAHWAERMEGILSHVVELEMASTPAGDDTPDWLPPSAPAEPRTTQPALTTSADQRQTVSAKWAAARARTGPSASRRDLEAALQAFTDLLRLRGASATWRGTLPPASWEGMLADAEPVHGRLDGMTAATVSAAPTAPLPPAPLSMPVELMPALSATQHVPPAAAPALPAASGAGVTRMVSGSAPRPLSSAEVAVLRRTSTVHGVQFLPWDARADAAVANTFPPGWDPSAPPDSKYMFKDRDGLLRLGSSQKKRFARWARLHEIVAHRAPSGALPYLVAPGGVHEYRVKQTAIGDCSVVSSLVVMAQHQRLRGSRPISDMLLPHSANHTPVYNPFGRYIVRLQFNGCHRAVVVDDRLPVDASWRPVCAFSSDPCEFWPSIVEKAYMKLANGGYDFPGSDSGVDMSILTGSFPETVRFSDPDFDSARLWARVSGALAAGDSLVTASTSTLTDAQEESKGLAGGHAYALLGTVEVPLPGSGGSQRLVRLKNPWGRVSWTGAFGPNDTARWTPDMCRAAQYDPQRAASEDIGVFFISWEDLLQEFARVHISWTSALLQHRVETHGSWLASDPGPRKDDFDVGLCPQFALRAAVPPGKPHLLKAVLTRHVLERDAEAEGSEGVEASTAPVDSSTPYLSLRGYARGVGEVSKEAFECLPVPEQEGKQWASQRGPVPGRRVHLFPPASWSTKYARNPTLVLDMPLPPGDHRMTLVLSQLSRNSDTFFTLRVLSSHPVELTDPMEPAGEVVRVPQAGGGATPHLIGAWSQTLPLGTQPRAVEYWNNPQVALHLPRATALRMHIVTRKPTAPHIRLFRWKDQTPGPRRIGPDSEVDLVGHSGAYRTSTNNLAVEGVQSGWYTAVVSAYTEAPGTAFVLSVFTGAATDLSLTTAELSKAPSMKLLPEAEPGDSKEDETVV